jgi:hypothetical protein
MIEEIYKYLTPAFDGKKKVLKDSKLIILGSELFMFFSRFEVRHKSALKRNSNTFIY